MKNNSEISVPSPCPKLWQDMAPSGHGRYCGHCETEVIDFTQWSDLEIKNYLLNTKSRVCGRIDQVIRPAYKSPLPLRFSLLSILSITSVLTLSYARTRGGDLETVPAITYKTEISKLTHTVIQSDTLIVRGRIVSDDTDGNFPLYGAAVWLKGNYEGRVITDRNGAFEFRTKKVSDDPITLVISYMAFKQLTINIAFSQTNFHELGIIKMSPVTEMIIGEVVIPGYKPKL